MSKVAITCAQQKQTPLPQNKALCWGWKYWLNDFEICTNAVLSFSYCFWTNCSFHWEFVSQASRCHSWWNSRWSKSLGILWPESVIAIQVHWAPLSSLQPTKWNVMGVILSNTFDGNDTSSAEGRMTGTQNSVLSCFLHFMLAGSDRNGYLQTAYCWLFLFFAYMVYQQHATVKNLRSVADNLWMGHVQRERCNLGPCNAAGYCCCTFSWPEIYSTPPAMGWGVMYRVQRWCKFVTCRLHFLAGEFCSSVPKNVRI